MVRGEIWWADLQIPRGSEPGYFRPVLIIQNSEITKSKIQTVIAVAITSNLDLANARGNILLTSNQSGLERDSVINMSQLVTVDKEYMYRKVGKLSSEVMMKVNEGLRLVLSL